MISRDPFIILVMQNDFVIEYCMMAGKRSIVYIFLIFQLDNSNEII